MTPMLIRLGLYVLLTIQYFKKVSKIRSVSLLRRKGAMAPTQLLPRERTTVVYFTFFLHRAL